MYTAVILPLANEDIKEAAEWYNIKQNGLGKRFVNEIRTVIMLIRQNPKSFAIRYDNTRCALLQVFPFMIHYSIDIKRKEVIIAAVYHTSLSPEIWAKR